MKEYVLGTSDHELARLQLQQDVWGGITDGFLDRLGIRNGARVLDVGCGPGLLIESFRRRVGAAGEVVALDESPRWIEHVRELRAELGWGNVQTVESRVQEIDLEPGSFDLVFLRWVLGFLPEPEDVLARLTRLLRPGGVLALMDYNHEGVSLFPPSRGFDAAIRGTRALYETRGGDTWIMGRITPLFHGAGLTPKVFEPYVIAGDPSSPAFRWADAFFPFHVENMARDGLLSAEEKALFDAEWKARRSDPNTLFFSPIVVGAAARKD